jgi:serine O-acetyltransferase
VQENRSYFKADLKRYYMLIFDTTNPTLKNKIKLWIASFGLHCVAIYRFGWFSRRLKKKNFFLGIPLRLIHVLLDYHMKIVHHVDIDKALIGPGFNIVHVGTIYIGPIKIGENFMVTHNVTIGSGGSKARAGLPNIGNNVRIETGSVIYGNITIGNNVVVADGCILSRNVPDNFLVGGNPGRILMKLTEG